MKYGEQEISKINPDELEIWPNPNPENDYIISITLPEFTCKCPRSGYPDFATIYVEYIPSEYVIELKALKLYINSFRDRYISHEQATNEIFNTLNKRLNPKALTVKADFNPRGNVHTVITVKKETKTTLK